MKIPFRHKVRWKMRLSKSQFHIRCGIVLFEVCYKHIQPAPNNVSLDQQVTGVWVAALPLDMKPGQVFSIHGWRKVKVLDAME